MKLLTLNTHSLVEENYEQKLRDFVSAIAKERPGIIALQEVNQTAGRAAVPMAELHGYSPCRKDIVIREDNHVFRAARMLREMGADYYWTWLPLKLGYDKYDEGIALMSRSPILETDIVPVSTIDDYNNWKTRKLLGIRTADLPTEWFFSVHLGWWNDPEEPFQQQWKRTEAHMVQYGRVWLMGDFNSPAEVRDEGYDQIVRSCWQDSFVLAERKDSGHTVGKIIDGWKDKISVTYGMRIDQIWCSEKADIRSSRVIFNSRNYPVVSDHYGVLIEYERS
ncbi:MAG: endonuclease/exonuclease/phosphatase family protein [Ruminococcus sp.]|nr:endonuclease/exonuclease/phosphatase family protein [Ruminococcus sp.]